MSANFDLPMALGTLGQVIFRSSRDYAAARPYFEEAARVGREIGQMEGATWTWNGWGMAAYQAGEYDEARRSYQAGLRLSEGVPGGWLIENMNRSGLADVAWRSGDYATAEMLYTEALSAWRRSGNRGAMARILECLAFVAKARAQSGAGD